MCVGNVVFINQSYDVWKVLDSCTGSIVDSGRLVSGRVHAWNHNRKRFCDAAILLLEIFSYYIYFAYLLCLHGSINTRGKWITICVTILQILDLRLQASPFQHHHSYKIIETLLTKLAIHISTPSNLQG